MKRVYLLLNTRPQMPKPDMPLRPPRKTIMVSSRLQRMTVLTAEWGSKTISFKRAPLLTSC